MPFLMRTLSTVPDWTRQKNSQGVEDRLWLCHFPSLTPTFTAQKPQESPSLGYSINPDVVVHLFSQVS